MPGDPESGDPEAGDLAAAGSDCEDVPARSSRIRSGCRSGRTQMPLNTMPTGEKTLRSLPPHASWTVSGSSVNF